MLHHFFSDSEQGFWRFYSDAKVFNAESEEQLHSLLNAILFDHLKAQRVLLLTDRGVSTTSAYRRLFEAVRSCPTVALLKPEGDEESLKSAIQAGRACCADAIVALGGGSVLDGGKLVAACVSAPRSLAELPDMDVLPNRIPLICIPTTFGTGSEVNMYSHVKLFGRKRGLRKHWLTPEYAILFGGFAASLSKQARYLTAIDAYIHAYECAALKREVSPVQSAILRTSLELQNRYFTEFVSTASKRSSSALATASMLAGLGLNNGRTGLIHTLGVALAQITGLPHAESVLPFIAPVMAAQWSETCSVFCLEGPYEVFWERDLNTRLEPAREILSRWAFEFVAEDIEEVLDIVEKDTVLFKESPIPLTRDVVRRVVHESLAPWLR